MPVASADTRLARVLEKVGHDLAAPHTMDSMAALAAMGQGAASRGTSARSAARRRCAWLAAQRLAQAQRLLEQSELSIDAVAEAVGMGTAAALRQQFRQQIGVSPTAWRKSFAHRAGR